MFSTDSFDNKLNKLLDSWKEIKAPCSDDQDSYVSMADIYEHQCSVNEQSSTQKLEKIFGPNEKVLNRIYELNESRSVTVIAGSYDLERTNCYGEFLELFFVINFVFGMLSFKRKIFQILKFNIEIIR